MGKAFNRYKASIHDFLQRLLPAHGVRFKYEMLESLVQISTGDRSSPEGDDLLAFYLHRTIGQVSAEQQEMFWQAVAEVAQDDLLRKRESFFWIEGGLHCFSKQPAFTATAPDTTPGKTSRQHGSGSRF